MPGHPRACPPILFSVPWMVSEVQGEMEELPMDFRLASHMSVYDCPLWCWRTLGPEATRREPPGSCLLSTHPPDLESHLPTLI